MVFVLSAIGFLILVLPTSVSAFEIGQEWANLCDIIPCSSMGGGAEGLRGYLVENIVTVMEAGFVAVTALALFTSALRMVLKSNDETAVTESRTAFIYAIFGCAVVGLAHIIARAIAPSEVGAGLIDQGAVATGIGNIVLYIKMIITTLLIVNIVIQGFRLITAQGQEEQTSKAKNRLIFSFIGAGIILLANAIAVSVNPELGTPDQIGNEIVGIANFMLTILGFLAVIALIVAGAMLALHPDDGVREKVKSIIKTVVFALIVAIVSYALVLEVVAL